MGSKESNAAKIEEDTTKKIHEMKQTVADHKGKVIDYLILQSFKVDAKVHQNFRSAIEK